MMGKIFLGVMFFWGALLSTKAQEEKYIGLFVYNFTKYFDWPDESKTNDFIIQVFGHQSVYTELQQIAKDKIVGSQKIVVEHITSPEQISTNNNILFLGHWQTRYLETITEIISNKPVLLVTEFEGLLEKGAAINFIVRDGKIKFELNTINTTKRGLKLDPRLRELAFKVVD